MLPHYRQPEETGQGISGFPKLRIRRLPRNLAESFIRTLINRRGMEYFKKQEE
jgi:hypothetical protein